MLAALALVASAAGIGWYAKWGGTPPITVKVAGIDNLPAEEQQLFRAAMQDWSLSPSVEVVAGNGKVKVVVDTHCPQACFVPNSSNGVLHGGTIHINPAVFPWSDEQWVYCHELGHVLGLDEVAPGDDADSCMAGAVTVHPTQQDYDELALMYPLAG